MRSVRIRDFQLLIFDNETCPNSFFKWFYQKKFQILKFSIMMWHILQNLVGTRYSKLSKIGNHSKYEKLFVIPLKVWKKVRHICDGTVMDNQILVAFCTTYGQYLFLANISVVCKRDFNLRNPVDNILLLLLR